jgi:alkylation response protein AidB-like acyl-CoA dehydrogenase
VADTALAQYDAAAPAALDSGASLAAVRAITADDLAPMAARIDLDGVYPERVLRDLGKAGAYDRHTGLNGTRPDLNGAIDAVSVVAEECLSTAFCVWCQDALVWYLRNTGNESLRRRWLAEAAAGRLLGGTALSNPMKSLAGIEPLRLHGERVDGGYVVSGQLPFVSNLGPGHAFGAVFDTPEGGRAMALLDTDMEGMRTNGNARFCALEGTRTMTVLARKVFVPDERLLADPAEPFLAAIKPGFILMQCGMAIGLIRACIAVMHQTGRSLGHVNAFLPEQADVFEEALETLNEDVARLARSPLESDPAFMARVLRARLEASEWSLRAAQAAMLHAGARGFIRTAAPQRRLREAAFIAIVTPAVKHLRKELATLES